MTGEFVGYVVLVYNQASGQPDVLDGSFTEDLPTPAPPTPSPPSTPADELRAAAATIRARAERLRLAHWFAAKREGDDWVWWIWAEDEENPQPVLMVQTDEGDVEREADLAEHIATWSPPPALAVADLLETMAEFLEERGYRPGKHVAAALAVARAIGGQT